MHCQFVHFHHKRLTKHLCNNYGHYYHLGSRILAHKMFQRRLLPVGYPFYTKHQNYYISLGHIDDPLLNSRLLYSNGD